MDRRLSAIVLLVLSCGCYTTRVETGAPAGPELEDRQWFTVGGLVPLSPPAGGECPHGLAGAESKLSGEDILIDLGVALVGGAAGAAACWNESGDRRAACISAGTSLAPFLLAARTVDYRCLETAAQPAPAR